MNDPIHIFGWQRVDRHVTSSGQPSEQQLADIKAIGVTHVVNLGLRTHEKALADEAASVGALGMAYVHIPVAFDDPTQADFEAFRATMDALDGKDVHVHCIANLRVSAFFFRYRRERLGIDEADARAELEKLWKPGGVWAAFIGDEAAETLPHRFPPRDY